MATKGAGTLASPNIVVGDPGSSNAVLEATGRTGDLVVGSGQTISGIGTINATTTIQSGGVNPHDGRIAAAADRFAGKNENRSI